MFVTRKNNIKILFVIIGKLKIMSELNKHLVKSTNTSKDDLAKMLELFVSSKEKHPEMEVRFHRNSGKPITKMDYDNVIQFIQGAQYYCENNRKDGTHLLRIYPKDAATGSTSKLRCDINGLYMIDTYCKGKDNLKEILGKTHLVEDQIQFTSKEEMVKTVEFADFGFRVSYQSEFHSSVKHSQNAGIISGWSGFRKVYRFLNRVRFRHDTFPFFLDLSIVKSSTKTSYGNEAKHVNESNL